MKLATIILPLVDNADVMLLYAHDQLKHELLVGWGGFTVSHGVGGWRPPDGGKDRIEPIAKYEVAMERADIVRFRALAAKIARVARQDCVMVVSPNGDVEFVKPEKCA